MRGARPALALLLALRAAAPALAGGGAELFDLLDLDANARAVGLGGAYTAIATDSNALLYNPAGLGRIKTNEATFMHNQHVEGVGQQFVGVALRHGFGLQLHHASLGSVPRTTISSPDGNGSTLSASDTVLGVGYGRALNDRAHLGAGLKYHHASFGDASAGGYGVDLGGLYTVPQIRGLVLGGSLLNIGPDVKFQQAKEKLPTLLRLGAGYEFKHARSRNTLAFDLSKSRRDAMRVGLGGEMVVDDAFAVRVGVTTRQNAGAGVSVGLGYKGRNWGGDYAFSPLGELGRAHRLSVSVRWGPVEIDPASAEAPKTNTPEWRLLLADKALQAGDREGAKGELTAGLAMLGAKDRRRVRFWERQGNIAVLEGEWAQASARYMDGIKLAYERGFADESVADAYVGLGLCLVASKDLERAVRSFQKGIEIGPSPAALRLAQQQLRALHGR